MTLLVTLMRYVYYYRVFLSSDNYELVIKFAASIQTSSESVRTMVFMVINAFLTIRTGDFSNFRNFSYYFNSENAHNVAK